MLRRLYVRARGLDEFKADALLALAFAVAGIVESIVDSSGGHSRPLTAVGAVALSVPVAWRWRNTLGAVIGFLVVAVATAPLNTFLFTNLTSSFIIALVLAYTIGRHETGSRLWVEMAAFALTTSAVAGIGGVSDALWLIVALGAPALAGRAIRNRALYQQEMRQKARRLEGEREARAQRAVDDERSRIATELQAVVANGLSAMVVQSEAVPRLLRTGEPAAAGQTLAVIEEIGRDALAEMRRLLGVLRRDGEGPGLAPQPTLARADALIAQMGAQGVHAAMAVEGEPVSLSPGVDLAGFRVLQEALASATRAHGVSQADVSIVYSADSVLVKVSDDRDSPDGLEPEVLRALRERVSLYGGALRAVPGQGSRGFEVEVRLPVGGPL